MMLDPLILLIYLLNYLMIWDSIIMLPVCLLKIVYQVLRQITLRDTRSIRFGNCHLRIEWKSMLMHLGEFQTMSTSIWYVMRDNHAKIRMAKGKPVRDYPILIVEWLVTWEAIILFNKTYRWLSSKVIFSL